MEQSPGKPNGVSLALMARMKRPALRVIFVGQAEIAPLVGDVGMLLPSPASAENVAAVAIGDGDPEGLLAVFWLRLVGWHDDTLPQSTHQ